MTSRSLTLAPLLAASVLAGPAVAHAAPSERPNVIVINIDDMGYGDMSNTGNPYFTTPNFDRLAEGSIRFDRFHVAPMCTPTRSMLLTGVDAMRNGARWVGTHNSHLRTDLPTMPEMFRDSGYRTGLFGKWHVGDNYPMRPQDRGFEESIWHPQQEIGTVNDFFGNDYFDDVFEHNGVRKQFEGYCTDVWFREAMNWMEEMSQGDAPFLCWIPTNVPHGPYFVDQAYRDRVPMENLNPDIVTFFGMMTNLDDNMGRLLDWMDETGLSDNTIVVFLTDNGATGGYHTYNAGMRGLKTMLWEGGHRVPLFIRWPAGGLMEPTDVYGIAVVQDLLPTLLELTGVEPPPGAAEEFDGISLAGVLRGEEEIPDRTLVVQFMRQNDISKWDACIMRGPWRLVNAWSPDPLDPQDLKDQILEWRRSRTIKLELYNIEEDPGQRNDLIAFRPDVVHDLMQAYEEWWARTEPETHLTGTIVVGNDAENPSFISAPSWANVYFTNIRNVFDGRRANGYWNLHVDQAGEYQFELRRWPEEADTPIAGAASVRFTDPFVHGEGFDGVALPITTARMQIRDFDQRIDVSPTDTAAVFTTRLDEGPAELRTWFYDADGQMLCGAYYVYVTRK